MATATFQSAVNINLGFGVVGELIVDGPQRAESLTLDNVGGSIGNFFTKSNATGVATQGGTIGTGVVMAGFLVNPKAYASFGGTNSLDPSLTLPPNSQGEFLLMGTIVVAITGAANIGDLVQYNTTTGALSCVAPGASATAGNALIPNCVVYRYPTAASGLIAVRITN
jgi:hypothetical protein